MSFKCEYCQSVCTEGASKCGNCGAPISTRTPDYRFCPDCNRRLLSLGSPACNYCGLHLPDNYLKAREATLRRINEASTGGASDEEVTELEKRSDDALRHALKSLFDLDQKTKRK
jgi:hypothetical protein